MKVFANAGDELQEVRPLRRLAEVVEAIRMQRVRDVRYGVRMHQKTFSVTELTNEVFPAYPSLVQGNLQRLPPRSVVMQIGRYLECSLSELNYLLRSAQYIEEHPDPPEGVIEEVIHIAKQVIEFLPVPSLILTRDWNIQGVNRHILTLIGMTEEELAAIPPEKLNLLHLIFDPEYPVRDALSPTREIWEGAAVRNIAGFKAENIWNEHDDWYHRLVNSLMKLPDFATYWPTTPHATESDPHLGMYVTDMLVAGESLRFRSLFSKLGDRQFPQISMYIPADEESKATFTKLGMPTPENRWLT